jgi:formate dehydrogenase major subunit
VVSNPAARVFAADKAMLGDRQEFPYVATTYRLTEHFHFWTKHSKINASLQPEQFVEIGEELARELGIANGEKVAVRSKRGAIKAVALVTKRIKALTVAGQTVHQIGIPIHWGFTGATRKGYIANTLTPFLGDANTQTPEFKAFLVNVEKDLSELMPHTHKPGEGHEERRRPNGATRATEKTSWLARILKGRTEV